MIHYFYVDINIKALYNVMRRKKAYCRDYDITLQKNKGEKMYRFQQVPRKTWISLTIAI